MLLSMTGFGEAHLEEDGVSAAVEIRTVNSRYYKAVIRLPEGYSSLESMLGRATVGFGHSKAST